MSVLRSALHKAPARAAMALSAPINPAIWLANCETRSVLANTVPSLA